MPKVTLIPIFLGPLTVSFRLVRNSLCLSLCLLCIGLLEIRREKRGGEGGQDRGRRREGKGGE